MIRVIYKWRVEKPAEQAFRVAWAKATADIRKSTIGARGSFLLQSRKDSAQFVTIARWDSLEDWQSYWSDSTRAEMQEMHAVAERLSVDVFDEIEDYTF